MSPTTNQTFLFISGGLNDSSPWNPLRQVLAKHNYPTAVVELPSITPSQPLEDFTPDVLAIRTAVQALIEEGKDVIVVMHSYSGFPGSEALLGQSKKEREERGNERGVVRLVYIMAFMLPEGMELVPRGS
jgi:pimeloyl-ACP methyl ester carboxylesterase